MGADVMRAPPFRRVGVLMGGVSAEREVSLQSGAAVARGLAESGYAVVPIDVRTPDLDIPSGVEAVFVALHGDFGEDGQVQALLNAARMPYTGSGAQSSRNTFDKALSKRIFADAGIASPEYEVLRDGMARSRPLPVVVKPARQGSSFGVHRVFSEAEWPAALADALAFGDEAIVERYVAGRELTVSLVGETLLPIVEIMAENDWYDYTAKYTRGRTRYQVAEWMSAAQRLECRRMTEQACAALGCRDLARADLRMDEDGRPFLLEVNTIPGFTETSLVPKAAAWAGLSFPALCDEIMRRATVKEEAADEV